MRWLIAIQLFVLVALLVTSGFCLSYGKPEQFALLNSSGQMHGEFLRKLETQVSSGYVEVVRKVFESEESGLVAIGASYRFVHSIGEMLQLLSLFQLVAIVVTVKINRREASIKNK